jgi:hypothetical protein
VRYAFIRPTKVGGTSVGEFLSQHYSSYFYRPHPDLYVHHTHCGDVDHPVIIFRDPVQRFYSIFKFWKFGSESNPRNPKFLREHEHLNINDFIRFIQDKQFRTLQAGFFRSLHVTPQSYWYTGFLENIIVIKYSQDLQKPINKLLDFLNIEKKPTPLLPKNISKNISEELLSNQNLKWINQYFRRDYELLDMIENKKRFKHVII